MQILTARQNQFLECLKKHHKLIDFKTLIAQELGLHRVSVDRYCRVLLEKNIIRRIPQRKQNGARYEIVETEEIKVISTNQAKSPKYKRLKEKEKTIDLPVFEPVPEFEPDEIKVYRNGRSFKIQRPLTLPRIEYQDGRIQRLILPQYA